MFDLDMTQPDRTANAILTDLRATGKAYAEAKRESEDLEADAKVTEAAFKARARTGQISIGEKATVDAVKDAVILDADVQNAQGEARDAAYKASLRKIAYDTVRDAKEMFNALCYLHSKVD